MKKLSALLAAAALVGAASAYAANPFSDVPTDSWAYQAVSQLAAEGVVVGYPDGTFGGEKNITRYEMAQIIARALAVEDRANAEQRAVINKLAQEFGSELNSLGVRVAGLENRIGNVKITGDARLRYDNKNAEEKIYVYNDADKKLELVEINKDNLAKLDKAVKDAKAKEDQAKAAEEAPLAALNAAKEDLEGDKDNKDKQKAVETAQETYDKALAKTAKATEEYDRYNSLKDTATKAAEKSDSWAYRVRLTANAKVNENTNVGARFVLASEFGEAKSTDVKFDRLYVNHSFGNVDVTAGRQGLFIGNGLAYDGALDGVVANTNLGPVNVVAGYGYAFDMPGYKANTTYKQKVDAGKIVNEVDVEKNKFSTTFVQVSGDVVDGVNLAGYYAKLNGQKAHAYGVAASAMVGDVDLHGEYVKLGGDALKDKEGKSAWTVGTSYTYGPAKLFVDYVKYGENANLSATTFDTNYTQNWKGFIAGVEYAVAKNTTAKFVYTFKGSPVEKFENVKEPAAKYYAQLVYKF